MIGRLSSRTGFAGLGTGGRATIAGYGILAGGRALSLVLLAQAVAEGIASVVSRTDQWRSALILGLVGALLRGVLAWLTRTFADRSAHRTKELLRRQLVARLLEDGASAAGSTSILATRGLDELDKYYRSVLPAITGAVVIPLFIGARLFFSDWLSAVIIAGTIILVPVFTALIGMRTRDQVSAAGAALARLSDHLVELAKGLPVLVGLGRAEEQTAALRSISDDYRAKTMATLRIAFLSSLALELISTISVAVVAVMIGFRLVWGDIGLDVALLVLILAPECFGPFRDLGAAFHAAQDGLAAYWRARAVLDAPRRMALPRVRSGAAVVDLSVRFADRNADTIRRLSFDVVPLEINALQGISGAGKSTVLAVLADELSPGGSVRISGRIQGFDHQERAWLPQRPQFTADTVLGELELYSDGAGGSAAAWIEPLATRLGIASILGADPEQLSPGEARRVAFARVCLRVEAGAKFVLLDEPTAHLDPASARAIAELIEDFRGRATVLLASHDEAVNSLAVHVVRLGAPTGLRGAGAPESPSNADIVRDREPIPLVDPARRSSFGELATFLRPAAGRYLAAALLGTLAVLFAVSLIAVSGWLIVKASEHPSIMYLGVAIVGVRFFGIGRAALHYAERLVTHDAVFDSVTSLRLALWRAFTARGATSRKLLGGASVLDRIVGAADEVRDLAPRVLIPAAVGVLTGAAVLVAIGLLDGDLVALFALCLGVCLIVAPLATILGDRAASVASHEYQSTVLRRVASALRAVSDLRGNAVAARATREIADADIRAGRSVRRSLWALGLGNAIIAFSCSATAVLTFVFTAPAVRAAGLPIELVAVLALLPLALIEPMVAATEAIQQWPALRFELGRINEVLSDVPESEQSAGVELEPIAGLQLDDLSAAWPGVLDATFAHASARVGIGDWLVIEGPSGSGKSTLLTVLLGYLAPEAGSYRINGVDSRAIATSSLRRRIAWAPQDGYLFDSSLRANLLISRERSDPPGDDEMLAVLDAVGLSELIGTLSHGLDTSVGAGGAALSGGQRQRIVIARTLLTRADAVLLDEPTAHLDAEASADLMADLRSALRNKVVVMVTHHHEDLRPTDVVVRLRADGVSVPATELVPV